FENLRQSQTGDYSVIVRNALGWVTSQPAKLVVQQVVTWGSDAYGQTDVPIGLSNVVAISAGNLHSLALKENGTMAAWGDDEYGQTDIPPGSTNMIAIAAGYYHNLALRADGRVIAWGLNLSHQTNVPP